MSDTEDQPQRAAGRTRTTRKDAAPAGKPARKPASKSTPKPAPKKAKPKDQGPAATVAGKAEAAAGAAKKGAAQAGKAARKAAGDKKTRWAAAGIGVGSAAVAAAVLYATRLRKSSQPSPQSTLREPEES